ncbi:hypothetical protein GGU45_003316 [Niabella hirudinis]
MKKERITNLLQKFEPVCYDVKGGALGRVILRQSSFGNHPSASSG